MVTIKTLTILWAVIAPLAVTAQVNIDSIKVDLSTFSAGLKAKDYTIVQKAVAPEFGIYTYTWPSAQSLLSQIWESQEISSL